MQLTYRGIKHSTLSSARQTHRGTLKETYRGITLWNRVAKAN